jgi:two-component system sensor histidine kinase PilS (NtrC family)
MAKIICHQDRDLLFKIKVLLSLRVTIITVFMGGLFLSLPRIELYNPSFQGIVSLIILTYLSTIAYSLILKTIENLYLFSYLLILGDLLIETGIIYFTGGIESPFSSLYILSIIAASIIIYRSGGYIIASIASILYGIVADLGYYQIIAPIAIPQREVEMISAQYFLYKVFLNISAFFLIAFLGGYLAESLKRTGKELVEKESDLIEMGDQVRRADRLAAIGRIAAGMAHEIRNPLASISGSIQLLREELPLDASYQKLMNIVLTETDRLNRIITDFLTYARPAPPQLQACDINNLLKETIALIKNSPYYSSQIAIELSFAQKEAEIMIDSNQMKQVFWNLSINALQAMPSGGILRLSTRWLENPWKDPDKKIYKNLHSPLTEIIISDTGIGLPDQDKFRIFDPFFTTKDNGSGLGLAIVYRIIEEHKGYIEVDSKEGEGTSFHIWLPQRVN